MEELFTAVEKNDINKVTRLLEAGADVNGTNISVHFSKHQLGVTNITFLCREDHFC